MTRSAHNRWFCPAGARGTVRPSFVQALCAMLGHWPDGWRLSGVLDGLSIAVQRCPPWDSQYLSTVPLNAARERARGDRVSSTG